MSVYTDESDCVLIDRIDCDADGAILGARVKRNAAEGWRYMTADALEAFDLDRAVVQAKAMLMRSRRITADLPGLPRAGLSRRRAA